jgi:glycosyltransferase involved in cell wall biosynthesis
MSSLRILHVVPYYERAWAYGGIPRVATAMARGLARNGHRVTVCTTDACDASTRLPVENRDAHVDPAIDVHVFPNVSNALAYHWQFFTPRGLGAHLRATAGTFDVAHLHACRNLPVSMAARALRTAGVPYVLSPNGTAPLIERRFLAKRAFDATFGRNVLSHAARVLAVTEAERRQLRQLRVPDDNITVLPNPVDEREFETPGDPGAFRRAHALGTSPIVLFLGKLTPRKGVDVLLRAFARLDQPELRLVIAGNDMGAGAALRRLTHALGLASRTFSVGLLRDRNRLDALAAAAVVAYPSRDEVFGLVAAEALLCGTPVVVSHDSGCGEVVGTVGGGLVVPYGDDEKLAAAMSNIVGAQTLWRDRARIAAGRVRRLFGAAAVCASLEAVYADVVARSRANARRTA